MSEYKLVPVEPDEQWARALHDVCRNGKDVYYDQDLLLAMIYNVLAAAPAVSAEPVGWVYGNSFWEKGNPRLPDDAKRYGRPLYAHPPAADPVADKLADALIDAAEEWARYVEVDTAPRTLVAHLNAALAEWDERQKGGA